LTSVNYGATTGHRSYVDASPNAGDVFINGSWKTLLVGGLGKGGQGIFALDITDPDVTNFQEGNASSLVLWEFNDADDRDGTSNYYDLGYTYGQPAIVRLADGNVVSGKQSNWGVVVGNGYNNIDARSGLDTAVSSTGNGVIYILSVSDGSILRRFDTGVGTADDPTGAGRPNGVATTAPVDTDGDNIVDYIYAGDLFGNVWKLDVRDADKANWGFAFENSGAPQPFFTAKDSSGNEQPITTRLEVGFHPTEPGQIVLFGTGKYIEVGDNASTGQQTQTFYGIWDRNEAQNSLSVITRSHLLKQEILEETLFQPPGTPPPPAIETRITSTTPITWHTSAGLPLVSGGGELGWFMDLYNTEGGNILNNGERMVADPVLRDGKIIFVTLVPDVDPCGFGGDSWLMEVAAASGARLPETPLDLSGDGLFTVADYVTDSSGAKVVASGKKSKVGILPAPGILKDTTNAGTGAGREFKYFSGSSGAIEQVTESRGIGAIGRQSWREIFTD
jgi:type IV pilus assembly protein PilY1